MSHITDGNYSPYNEVKVVPVEKQKIVTASNSALPTHSWIAITAVVLIVPSMISLFMIYMGANRWLTMIAWIIGFVILSKYSLTVLSGDAAAIKEIRESNVTERKQIESEERIARLHYESENLKTQATRDVALAQMEANVAAAEMNDQTLRLLQAMNTNLARFIDSVDNDTISVHATAPSFVPAHSDESREAAKKWIYSVLENQTEMPNLAQLKMPWNSIWVGKSYQNDAKELLIRKVLRKKGTGYEWNDDYSTIESAITHLGMW